MTLSDLLNRQVPNHYPTMYRDGYLPSQILMATRRKMLDQHQERQQVNEIKITSEVKIK